MNCSRASVAASLPYAAPHFGHDRPARVASVRATCLLADEDTHAMKTTNSANPVSKMMPNIFTTLAVA